MPDKTKKPEPLETRLEAKRSQLTTMREQLIMQLNGVDNQLYLIEQLLNPAAETAPEAAPEPEGTI